MKKLKIENKEILDLLNKKSKKADKAYEKTQEMEKLEKEYNTLIGKVKRFDEKVRPLIKDYTQDINFGEFEEISRIYKDDDGGWNIEIADRLEEFKKAYRKKKEEANEEENED